jgi:hypothetical protein
MTLLNNIPSTIQVGASAAYPVLSVQEDYRRVGPEDQARESYEEVTWALRCLTKIEEPTDIRTLIETLRTTLARRGVNVVLTERGTATTLTAANSLPGFPMVEHTATPEISYGGWQSFDLRVTDRRPLPDGSNIVEHTYTIRTTTTALGGIETRRSGRVRLANGQNAAAWVSTNVFADVATAAAAAGLAFVRSTEVNADAAVCVYEYTTSPITDSGGIANLTAASRDDRTSQEAQGNGLRVISGYAAGSGALAWANDQKLDPIPLGTVLVKQEGPTPASVPDGRRNFRYEYAVGTTLAGFSGIYILSLEEEITGPFGGRAINPSEYLSSAPRLRRGEERAYVYRQSSTIRFLGGTLASHGLTPLFSVDNQSGPDVFSQRRYEGPIRVVSIQREFVFTSPQTIPDVRRLVVVS